MGPRLLGGLVLPDRGGEGVLHFQDRIVDARGVFERESACQTGVTMVGLGLRLGHPQRVLADHPDGRRSDHQSSIPGVTVRHQEVGLRHVISDTDAEIWEMGQSPHHLPTLKCPGGLDGEGQTSLFASCGGEICEDLKHALILERLVVRAYDAKKPLGVGSTDGGEIRHRVQSVSAAEIHPFDRPVQPGLHEGRVRTGDGLTHHGMTASLPRVPANVRETAATCGRQRRRDDRRSPNDGGGVRSGGSDGIIESEKTQHGTISLL